MHELSLAEALVDQVNEILEKEGANRVFEVTVTIGTLSGVERDAFEFAFPMAAEGTDLAKAKLVIEEVPARIKCLKCGAETEVEIPFLECPDCKNSEVEIISGKDFYLKNLEIDS